MFVNRKFPVTSVSVKGSTKLPPANTSTFANGFPVVQSVTLPVIEEVSSHIPHTVVLIVHPGGHVLEQSITYKMSYCWYIQHVSLLCTLFVNRLTAINPLTAKLYNLNFHPLEGCVSLTRSTTLSEWKLFRFGKMEVSCFQILRIDVTFYLCHMFKRWYLMC